MLDTFSDLGQEIVLQEFVAESKGRDVRALVIGDRVIGAMRRQAKRGEFRSNIHRGGKGQPVDLPREYAEIAHILGCSEESARANAYQALRRLRARFTEPETRPGRTGKEQNR